MPLTPAQLASLKTDINNDPVLSVIPNTPDGNQTIADAYNATASPDFHVWRTSVFESEIVRTTTGSGTVWNWTAYIERTQGERDAWARLFMGGSSGMNPSLTNVRQGLADIFSNFGTAAQQTRATNQRNHLLVMCRRLGRRIEKLFATATTGPGNNGADPIGNSTNPGFMNFEGTVSPTDVLNARNLP